MRTPDVTQAIGGSCPVATVGQARPFLLSGGRYSRLGSSCLHFARDPRLMPGGVSGRLPFKGVVTSRRQWPERHVPLRPCRLAQAPAAQTRATVDLVTAP